MNEKHNSVVLVGLMGAGKSTVGRELASLMNYDFLDTDDELEKRMGVSIPVIFDVEGESGFREREAKVIEDIADMGRTVISTGGGVVISAENRANLRKSGTVVYLSATVDLLYERVKSSKNRPLIQKDDDIKATLTTLLKKRKSLYEEVADVVVETGSYSPQQMAKHILESIRS